MPFETAAIVARTPGELTLEVVRFLDPAPDELIVRMVATGICHADLAAIDGTARCKPPIIAGHEGAGIIEYVGTAVTSRFSVGQHVLLSIAFCETCKLCRNGHPAACRDMLKYNFGGLRIPSGEKVATCAKDDLPLHALFFGQSAFAQRSLVKASSVVPVATQTVQELQHTAPLGCGVMTGASSVLKLLKPEAGSFVAIWGAGAVGLGALLACLADVLPGRPAVIVVIDTNAERLPLALELGATHVLHALTEDVPSRLAELTDGEGLDFAIDCTGVPAVLGIGHAALGPMGTLLSVGAPRDRTVPAPFPIANHLSFSKRYIGTSQGDAVAMESIPQLIELQRAGRFPVEKLVVTYPWRDYERAVADMRSGKTVKPLLLFD